MLQNVQIVVCSFMLKRSLNPLGATQQLVTVSRIFLFIFNDGFKKTLLFIIFNRYKYTFLIWIQTNKKQ